MNAKGDLYNLRPEEFEKFCADVLRGAGYTEVSEVGGQRDQGVDIIAKKSGETFAVQVKHTKRPLRRGEIEKIAERIQHSTYKVDRALLMTSSPVDSLPKIDISTDLPITILGPEQILTLLSEHSVIVDHTLREALKRRRYQLTAFSLAILGVIISAVGLISDSYPSRQSSALPNLETRIKSVDGALEGIKGLEDHLTQIKSDMETTAAESKQIRAEYEKALQLKILTADQLAMMKKVLKEESWQQRLSNYLLGFLLGIASSITASIIYALFQQHRALTK